MAQPFPAQTAAGVTAVDGSESWAGTPPSEIVLTFRTQNPQAPANNHLILEGGPGARCGETAALGGRGFGSTSTLSAERPARLSPSRGSLAASE